MMLIYFYVKMQLGFEIVILSLNVFTYRLWWKITYF